ncbi:hypothetical protein FA15DRAFT_696061 [Coprinopsis marcescibilis]|uniref:Uncharacterized protein n=1 Tax=Coprinopsis marcescibilis TaxID=230819 RepID=A0A5C3KN37_COPMA|nr:hypothetical protein FA15DRAFT_696061 [Coprinopsis marcescibilis]
MEMTKRSRIKPERSLLAESPDSGSVLPGEPDKQTVDGSAMEFVEGLHVRSNPYRARIILALCFTIQSDVQCMATELASVPEALLDVCDHSPALLSAALRTKFIEGRTPVGWLFDHLPDSFVNSERNSQNIHSLLAAATLGLLESYCPSDTTAEKDLLESYCRRNSNWFFQRELNEFKKSSIRDTSYRAKSSYAGELERDGTVEFTVPHFRRRMLSDGFVDIRFVFWCCVWSYCIECNETGAWYMKHTIVEDPLNTDIPSRSTNPPGQYRCVTLWLGSNTASDTAIGRLLFPQTDGGKVLPDNSFRLNYASISLELLQQANQYIDSDGTLRGQLRFSPGTTKNDIELNKYE